MIWEEWINSSYSSVSFEIYDNIVNYAPVSHTGTSLRYSDASEVLSGDKIIKDYDYFTIGGGEQTN